MIFRSMISIFLISGLVTSIGSEALPSPQKGFSVNFPFLHNPVQSCSDYNLSMDLYNNIENLRIPRITIRPDDPLVPIMKNAEVYLGDEFRQDAKLTLPTTSEWMIIDNTSPNFGYVNKELWIRFGLDVYGDPSLYSIRINYPSTDYIEIVSFDTKTGECRHHYVSGDYLSQRNRYYDSHVFHIPLSEFFPQDLNRESIFYIRIATTGALIVPLEIIRIDELYKDETLTYIGFGLYFGVLLAMFVYNSILFVFTREKTFITYLLFLASYFLMIFSGYGFANRFWYPDSWYLTNHGFLVFGSLNNIASTIFSIGFLRLNRYFPRFVRLLYGMIVFIFLWMLGFMITGKQMFYLLIAANNLIPYLIIMGMTLMLFRNNIFARYFLVGWTIYISFYILTILRLIGLIPMSFFSYYGIQIGSAIEMLVLSVAIGHRLYDYKRTSVRLSQEMLTQKTLQAEQLRATVESKTRELQKSIQSIQSDVEVARGIQLSTIPKKVDWTKSGLDVGAFFFPKDRVSGDIYDLCQLDEDRFRIFLADATGHGIQAGFFTMSIRTEYERIKYDYSDTSQILRLLNQSIFKTFGDSVMLYSCFIIDIDISQRFFQYTSAGHPEQILYQSGELIELKSLNPILGFRKDIEIRSRSIPIISPFRLFLYSDGISEARNMKVEEYGLSRIIDKIRSPKEIKAERFLFEVFHDCNEFTEDVGFEDDITMIYIRSVE